MEKKKKKFEGEFKPVEIKNLPIETANFLHKKLMKELKKANDAFTFKYDFFCVPSPRTSKYFGCSINFFIKSKICPCW